MKLYWKIIIFLVVIAIIAAIGYFAAPKQKTDVPSGEESTAIQPDLQAPIPPQPRPPVNVPEIPYLQAPGVPQGGSGQPPAEFPQVPSKFGDRQDGTSGMPLPGQPLPLGSFDESGMFTPFSADGTLGAPGLAAPGPISALPMLPPPSGTGSSQGRPMATGPGGAIPLPPSGLKLPSLSEPVIEDENARAASSRIGQRFILPPIIGEDLLQTVLGEKKFTLVYADTIDNDRQEDITKLHGHVRIQYKDNIIESDEAIINREEDWARFFGEGGVYARNDDGELRCDELETFFEKKIANLYGPVDIIRYANTEDELDKLPDDATRREKIERALKKKQSHITCTDAEYDWGNKIGDLHNGVRIEQVDKYVECEELHFEREIDYALLTGDVELHQDNGQWLFDEKVITKDDKKVTQVVAKEKTTVNCVELEVKGEDDWYQFRDDVYGVQPDKEGKCDTATMDDSEDVQLLTLDGNVWLHQSNGDWLFEAEVIGEDESEDVKDDARKWATLTCEKLVMHTDTEDAKATGGVFLEQEHQNGKADEGEYLRDYDLIHLTGNVEVQREEKNTVFANEAFLFMTTRIFEARGDVRSTTWVDVEEEQRKRDEEDNENNAAKPEGGS